MPNYCSTFTPVVLPEVPRSAYGEIDLSVTNKDLEAIDLSSVNQQQAYIDQVAQQKNASILYGGYLEKRNLYKHSSYFASENHNDRNIHLGIDFWCPAGSPVVAPLNGTVHSFNNNINPGDYGPTILLKHELGDKLVYTLYGHLSIESLAILSEGQPIQKGETIAFLGDHTVNGGYSPHLHFQVMLALDNNVGDYPGVCSQDQLAYYQKNCIDPLKFLSF